MPHSTSQNTLFSAPYTQTGVQQLIQWLMDTQGIGQFELSKRSGLSPATVYQILNKTEKMITRPPRRSTISSLAEAVGARVSFQADRETFTLIQEFELPPTTSIELAGLLNDIGNVIVARRVPLKREERERILRVVKAVL